MKFLGSLHQRVAELAPSETYRLIGLSVVTLDFYHIEKERKF